MKAGANAPSGTVFLAPINNIPSTYVGSFIFVTLDDTGQNVLILEPGHSGYKTGTVERMAWSTRRWLTAGWTMVRPTGGTDELA